MGERLPDLFTQVVAKYLDVSQYSGSYTEPKFKNLLVVACQLCEKAMEMVNELHLFSKNESLDDLSATEIRYLCLPACLDILTLRKAKTGYLVFVWHCPCTRTFPNCVLSTVYLFHRICASRKVKVQTLEERLEKLATYVDQPHVDEETRREFNLTLVQKWLCVAQDEIISLQNELELLSKGDVTSESDADGKLAKPFRPFIITRSAAQAAVFGAGYPSLPTMTIEEFYEKQVAAGLLPPPKPLPQNTTGPSVTRIDPSIEERKGQEKKKEKQDELEDADDPEFLSKARAFDDFKDEHRRGSGNRMNRA
ncbi:unnamed protein product [Heterobilharzia americana]|nr:unnamed protein product [Heterobilharzia americana]